MKGTFQYVLLGIFGLFIVVGVFVFASLNRFSGSGGGGEAEPRATIWGTLADDTVSSVVRSLADAAGSKLEVTYRQFAEEEFSQSLIEALARGVGPDVIIFPHDFVTLLEDLITPIPSSSLSERLLRDTYVEEAELYRTPEGTLALPILIDPMVLYWNRSLFTNATISQPPKFWDELAQLAPRLSKTDAARNVTQSAIALGEFSNITHAKDIVALLFLQAGTPLVIRNAESGILEAVLSEHFALPEPPAVSGLRFFTEFSNPAKALYSWNRSLPSSEESFRAGTLAMYMGFASEAAVLAEKNPNLNFDIAPVPQIREGGAERTYGRLYGLALLKGSGQPQEAFAAMLALAVGPAGAAWSEASSLAPARRELLSAAPGDAYRALSYAAALRATAFLDPSPQRTSTIMESMVAAVTSGRRDVGSAVDMAQAELSALVQGINAQ